MAEFQKICALLRVIHNLYKHFIGERPGERAGAGQRYIFYTQPRKYPFQFIRQKGVGDAPGSASVFVFLNFLFSADDPVRPDFFQAFPVEERGGNGSLPVGNQLFYIGITTVRIQNKLIFLDRIRQEGQGSQAAGNAEHNAFSAKTYEFADDLFLPGKSIGYG